MAAFDNKESGIWTSLDFKRKKIRIAYWFLFSFVLLICLACLSPVVWVFISSFKDIKEILSVPPTLIPHSFHPEKLIEVWNSMNFGKYYINTILMSLGCLVFCIVSNGLAGYVLSRLKPKGANFVFIIIMWTMMMPNSIGMVPLFSTFIDFPIFHINLTNTYVPMWLMAGANTFYILVFKSFFDSIPISYIEAARIDGCSSFGIFERIMIPLSKPVIAVVSIFSLNGSWGDFFWPYLMLKNSDLYTITVQMFYMKNGSWALDTYLVSLLFAILPPVIIFIIFQKYIMTGFTMSGIKG